MEKQRPSRLRFNFGFLLEATLGTSRHIELAYPKIQISPDLVLTPLQGHFSATRTGEGIYIRGILTTKLDITCVRCLEESQIPVSMKLDDLYFYPPHTKPEGEYSIGEDGFLDLAPLVRELTVLEIPIQPICQQDCQGLCIECGQNLNVRDCGCEVDIVDLRLAKLRELLDS